MSRQSVRLGSQMQDYVEAHTTAPDELLTALAETTANLRAVVDMEISPDQGAFLTLVTKMIGATRAIEIGTFTGYASICIARGLARGGSLLSCQVSDHAAATAKEFWERAGMTKQIELRIGPALETLHSLPAEPQFDLAFIDADKAAYSAYWEKLVPRMRSGGVLLADNVFQSGRVVEAASIDADTVAIRQFNDLVVSDGRVEVVMLSLADGLTLARKI